MSLRDRMAEFERKTAQEALEKEEQRIKKLKEVTENDEVAQRTEWTPYKSGGASFKTVDLEQNNDGKILIKASKELYLFIAFFTLIFLIYSVIFVIADTEKKYMLMPMRVILTIIMTVAAVFIIRLLVNVKCFDVEMGKYYIGKYEKSKYIIDFNEIYAIQIIREYTGGKNRYYSYEINMVLNTGNRYNIMDHGNLNKIKENAQTIADILGVKLWDLSDV